MDWSTFWGSGNMPSMGNDPYEPTAEQRRRILQESLRGLGQGMVKAAFSPSWGGFGMAFNEGVANMSDIQKGGYDRMMEQNQKNALFKSNMEQEALATQGAKLDIESKTLKLDDDKEDHQIREALKSQAPAMLKDLYETTKSMLDTAEVPASLKPKLDLARRQLEAKYAMALKDPLGQLESFNTFAFNVADMAGRKDALQETMDQKAGDHWLNSGWQKVNPDGSIAPDPEGGLAWAEKRRSQELRQGEANIQATQALTDQRLNPRTTTDPTTKGQVSFTVAQVGAEVGKLSKDVNDMTRVFRVDDNHVDLGNPRSRGAAMNLRLDITRADKEGILELSPDEKLRLESLLNPDAQEKEAIRRLTDRANKINDLKGKNRLGAKKVAASDSESDSDEQDGVDTEPDAEQPKPIEYPPADEVKARVEKFGAGKVIAFLKKKGLSAAEIKKRYGI